MQGGTCASPALSSSLLHLGGIQMLLGLAASPVGDLLGAGMGRSGEADFAKGLATGKGSRRIGG